jgi:hypothetical protein
MTFQLFVREISELSDETKWSIAATDVTYFQAVKMLSKLTEKHASILIQGDRTANIGEMAGLYRLVSRTFNTTKTQRGFLVTQRVDAI